MWDDWYFLKIMHYFILQLPCRYAGVTACKQIPCHPGHHQKRWLYHAIIRYQKAADGLI